jgi:hypothetical protein
LHAHASIGVQPGYMLLKSGALKHEPRAVPHAGFGLHGPLGSGAGSNAASRTTSRPALTDAAT